jgi:hypothetical protein
MLNCTFGAKSVDASFYRKNDEKVAEKYDGREWRENMVGERWREKVCRGRWERMEGKRMLDNHQNKAVL